MNPRSPRYEVITYLLAFLLAFGLRFIRLGVPALTDSEALLALDTLHLTQGATNAISSHVAYTNLTALLFFVFGTTNFLARFWPALAGCGLVFVPFLFREQIKPRPAILLAFFLAIDPALVALSRQVGSPILAIAFSLFAAGFLFRHHARLAGIFLALALLSGPSLWVGLLSLLLAWMIAQSIHARPRRNEAKSTSEAPSSEPQLPATNTHKEPHSSRYASLFISAVATLVTVSSLFLVIPQGLSAWLGALPEYISGWTTPANIPSSRLFLALGIYQPLGLLFSIIAIVRGWQNGSRRVVHLSLWMLVALLLTLFYPARQVSDLVWVILPMWALTALEFARYLDFAPEERIEIFGVVAFTVLLIGFAWMDLNAMYFTPLPSPQGNIRLSLFIGALLLLVISVVLVGYGWSPHVARIGAAWGIMLILGLYTLGTAWGATGLRIPSAVELWVSSPHIAQADLLTQTADQISEWATGHADEFPVTVFGVDSPALLWALRNHNPEVVLALDPASTPALVITPPQQTLELPAAYRGQDFTWRQIPTWEAFPVYYLRWLTLRELPVQSETLVLWVRSDLFTDSESSLPSIQP